MTTHPWLGPAWDPSGDVVALQQEMNRLFEMLLGLVPGSGQAAGVAWAPPMDVCDSPTALRVLVELPGLTQEQIGIEVTKGTLRIRGSDRPIRASSRTAWSAWSGAAAPSRAASRCL